MFPPAQWWPESIFQVLKTITPVNKIINKWTELGWHYKAIVLLLMINLCRSTMSDNANVIEIYITCQIPNSSQSNMRQTLHLWTVPTGRLGMRCQKVSDGLSTHSYRMSVTILMANVKGNVYFHFRNHWASVWTDPYGPLNLILWD